MNTGTRFEELIKQKKVKYNKTTNSNCELFFKTCKNYFISFAKNN